MIKFRVYTQHEGVEHPVLETTRTDERVAREDARIFKEIVGRPAFVESNEGAP